MKKAEIVDGKFKNQFPSMKKAKSWTGSSFRAGPACMREHEELELLFGLLC